MQHWKPEVIGPDLNELRLARRLSRYLAPLKMPNGTLPADAVHDALLADMREAGASTAALNALTDEQILNAYCAIVWEIDRGCGQQFTLPFGSTAVSTTPGTLRIGAQDFVLDAGRSGLHPLETVTRAAHGRNLELLTAAILRKTKRLACRRLGAPIPVQIVGRDSRQLIQFAPLAEAGGAVLQRGTWDTGANRFCAALPWQIEELAKSIVADMRVLWNRRVEISKRVNEVRKAAEAGLQAESGQSDRVSVRAIALELKLQHDYPVDVYIEYHAIDEALRPGTVVDFMPANWDISDGVHSPPKDVVVRSGVKDRLVAAGAQGWIDEIAHSVASAAPEGRTAVLARLSSNYETMVTLPTTSGPMYATLFWQDGVIKAEITFRDKLEWFNGHLELKDVKLPETIIETLPGRLLSSLVDLPFASTAKIAAVDSVTSNTLRLRVDPVEMLVNCDTGRVWSDTQCERLIWFGKDD